ncbi:MAG TPA: S-layer homology domain-containing protein [Candidatus Acidoferrum sp.]|nr:S-layer homology domain-containing protein [Candidatus Acidoferrum sp.]
MNGGISLKTHIATAFTALCTALCMVLTLLPASAAGAPETDVWLILSTMGVMTYNDAGDFEPERTLTRAQLAKILVTASPYKGEAAVSRTSPFGDVSYQHWAAPYIKAAQKYGIMKGYSDGTFRPEKTVTLEETLSALLGLLGYTPQGAYPYAQYAMAEDLGLLDGLTAGLGETLTRRQTAGLMYNALNTADSGASKAHATAIGYSMAGSELTLSDVMTQKAQGPYTYAGALSATPATVYIDGVLSSLEKLSLYDVYYLSPSAATLWAYTARTTGTLESVTPSREAPTAAVVSGKTVKLSGYAARAAAGVGGLAVGTTVTVLYDREGAAADIRPAEEVYASQLGVVLKSGAKSLTTAQGDTAGYYVTVCFTSGDTMDVPLSYNGAYLVGRAVKVSYSGGAPAVTTASGASASGYVNAASMKLGSAVLAQGVRVLDVTADGETASVFLSRLDGVTLSSEDVLLAAMNASGQIESLILNDVTGDAAQYGVATEVSEQDTDSGSKSSYTVDLGGTAKTYSFTDSKQNITAGPVRIYTNAEGETVIKNLTKVTVDTVDGSYVTDGNGKQHRITGTTLVYDVSQTTPILSTLDTLLAGSYGTVTAYVDKSLSEGGAVRVIYFK